MSIYCDDFLIYDSDHSEHLKFIRGISKERLRINPINMYFAKDKITFQRFQFASEGVEVDPRKLKCQNHKKPQTIHKRQTGQNVEWFPVVFLSYSLSS